MRLNPHSFAMAALLTALVAAAPLSTDMYLPALPDIGNYFGASSADVQMTLSVYLVGFAVAQLIVGPLSDRYGRRPVLVGGMMVFLLTSVICALAESLTVLIIARFMQAVGACAGGAVGRAVVRDIHTPKDGARLLAHMGTAMAIGPLVAPVIGGQLTLYFGWAANFWALAGLGAALFGIAFAMLPETHPQPDPLALSLKRMRLNYKTLFAARPFRIFVLANGFSFGGLFAFISGSSFAFIEVLGMSVETFGFAFSFGVLGYMAGTQFAARKVKTLGIERLVSIGGMLGLSAGVAGVVLTWAFPSAIAAIVGPMFFYAMSVGFIMPASMAGALAPYPHMAGAASALMGFIQMGMASVFGALVGVLYNGTSLPMMAVIALCGVLAWMLSRVAARGGLVPED